MSKQEYRSSLILRQKGKAERIESGRFCGMLGYLGLDAMIQQRRLSRRGRKIRTAEVIRLAILEACRTPAIAHMIMIKARVGYETFNAHANRLVDEGLIASLLAESDRGKNPKLHYALTEKGLAFLEVVRRKQGDEVLNELGI